MQKTWLLESRTIHGTFADIKILQKNDFAPYSVNNPVNSNPFHVRKF